MKIPRKLFEPKTFEWETLVPMMRELAKIAQTLYDIHPNFVALIPFWSRTKWLAQESSDLDLFLICEDPSKMDVEMDLLKMLNWQDGVLKGIDIHLVPQSRSDHERMIERGGAYTHEVHIGSLGATLWPHRLQSSRIWIRSLSREKKEGILRSLLSKVHQNEYAHFLHKEDHYDEEMRDTFVRRRMDLWGRRIKNILQVRV